MATFSQMLAEVRQRLNDQLNLRVVYPAEDHAVEERDDARSRLVTLATRGMGRVCYRMVVDQCTPAALAPEPRSFRPGGA